MSPRNALGSIAFALLCLGSSSSALRAQETSSEPGQQTMQSLKAMIENLGYQPKELKNDKGVVTRYLLTVASGGGQWKVIAEISPNQENLWIYANLAQVTDINQAPREVLADMLKANEKLGPSFFAFSEKAQNFVLFQALTNRGITPKLLRERIEMVARQVDGNERLWNPKQWPSGGGGPVAVSPEVQRLINELTSPDELVRLKAAKDLGKLGAAARGGIPALQKLAQDPDEDVRRVAANAIERIQGAAGPGPGPRPGATLAGTTWDGNETLSGFGRLKFQFDADGKVTMFDAKFAERGSVPGSWTQNGNQVKISFKDCVYEGTINGDVLSGSARFLESGNTWTFSLTRVASSTRAVLGNKPEPAGLAPPGGRNGS